MISGTTPSTIAAVVIRIGRSRMPAACSIASRLDLPAALQPVGDLDDQDAVLADQAHQRHQPDLGVDVQRRAAEMPSADEDQRAGDRHRHRDQDDQRIAEALEQRRQRQEDDDQREAEGADEAAGLLHVLPRRAAVVDRSSPAAACAREVLR